MRELSETLLAAQKEWVKTPYVEVIASNKTAGAVNLKWERLYSGSEPDYYNAAAMASDGSLLRFRIIPPSDSSKLYRQRVINPVPGSDFSNWTYLDQYGVLVVATCALGSEVSVFWIKSDRNIYWQKSIDGGASWGSPEIIDISPSASVYGIAATYKSNGDLALLFVEEHTLYVKRRISGVWQDKTPWDKTTGNLSGVACVHDGDWNLLVSGQDSAGNYRVWSLIYGDGGDITPGVWSELKELALAPAGGMFEYQGLSLIKTDEYLAFFTEKFSGTEAVNRPNFTHTTPGTRFQDSLFREAIPFNSLGEYGLAVAGHGDYMWLSSPSGVWRALLADESLDLSADVLSLKYELTEGGGKAVIELRNDESGYNEPGSGNLTALDIGSEVAVSTGYVTSAGNEVSEGLIFQIDALEHTSSQSQASLIIYASDGWARLREWQARQQMRWNQSGGVTNVKDIIAFILARVGLRLEVKSASEVLTGFYPDFTIQSGSRGDIIIRKLLSFVPDVIFIEGNTAYLINPRSSDVSVYSYGTLHPIFEAKYRKVALSPNRIQAEGYDPSSGEPVIVNSFVWGEIQGSYDRLTEVYDRNIDTVARAQERGESYLRQAEMASERGLIRVPVNCGEQRYDVIDITDSRAGLAADKRRVTGLTVIYDSKRGGYEERLLLGAV